MKVNKAALATDADASANVTADPSKRDRVLREAAKLFALEGFHGVSMRDIAQAAEVGLPLIVYHFGTKQKLYRAIFEHHKALFDERLAGLRRASECRTPDALEAIVAAFVGPILRSQASPEGVTYAQLVAREAADPCEETRGIISEYFDPIAREFIRAMQRALPDKAPGYIEWGYLFSVGALVMSVFDARITRISDGRCAQGDLARKTAFLSAFITAGLRGGPD